MSPGRKPVLADITHRLPQSGSNTPSSPLSSATCSIPGDENRNPARSLLEIFAAVNSKKRSLKLTNTDYDITPQLQASPCSKSVLLPSATNALTLNDKSLQISRTHQPTFNLVSLTTRQQIYGRRKNIPVYLPTRSYMKDYTCRSNDIYTFVSWDGTTLVPPFSCAYNNVANEARNLAVGDEDGSVHIVDTKTDDSHPGKTITIPAHKNAIFDLCWSKDDKRIITASGDKTARLHDVETQKCIGTFSGHNGTLKSVSTKHGDDNIFATSARDGAVLIWDIRCSSTTTPEGETIHRPANKLLNVHSGVRASPMKRTKQGDGPALDGSNTASSVQYMIHNEHVVASTGTQDGSIKYWDVRKHGSHFKVENPTPLQSSTYVPTTKRSHGLVSMALSPDGSALYAVSSDNHVYMYNATNLGSPIRRFSGENFSCSSYYIKISVSPDGDYVATGSSKDLYVWEVNRPEEQPLVFEGPEKEVSGVDWAKDIGNGTQLSACSDDATVRTWKPAVY
ncbi:hypothetical protein BGZ81_006223 [Podila clonocystis]|nr:hypothetical protein BGZ81_006223 [Podila clonocystis]